MNLRKIFLNETFRIAIQRMIVSADFHVLQNSCNSVNGICITVTGICTAVIKVRCIIVKFRVKISGKKSVSSA